MLELLEKLNPFNTQDASGELPGLDVLRIRLLQLLRARDGVLAVVPEKKKDISVVASSIAHSIATQPTASPTAKVASEPTIDFSNPVGLDAGIQSKEAAPEVVPVSHQVPHPASTLNDAAQRAQSSPQPNNQLATNQLAEAQQAVASSATSTEDAQARLTEILSKAA